jgi:hypothetical protein
VDGLDAFAGAPAEPGGAELVQLRQQASARSPEQPRVQAQPSIAEDSAWIEDLLARAADRVVNERFVPTEGKACTTCAFKRSCSAKPEGGQTVV